jgi:hypothetical protein
MIDEDMINKMRKCSYLLPDPGGEVVRECLDEIERLRKALLDITEPIAAMHRDLPAGYDLDGNMAVKASKDPEHYKGIARAALNPPNAQGQRA